ncbi:MAG: oxidoreductase [Candidatus Devosia euplotis]|nr:oxidoreductase [Candidatus Devosia euplotis]
MTTPHADAAAAGRFTSPGSEISVNRMGYGAMQLAGPGVFGPATDPDEARAVLHEALVLSVDHIDTSDFYDPLVTNDLIREALSPYPDKLTLATKIGAWRDDKSGWNHEHSADFLRRSVEDNLTRLDLSQMAIVNLRMFTPRDDIATLMQAMRQMQEEGLIGHIGVSTVDTARLQIARDIAPIVCVQNHCNLVRRGYDAMIDALNADGIAYVPYFPLGGFRLLQMDVLNTVATQLGESAQSVALAWLLQRSPNILVIPGTSSRDHLRSNIAAASLQLGAAALDALNGLG